MVSVTGKCHSKPSLETPSKFIRHLLFIKSTYCLGANRTSNSVKSEQIPIKLELEYTSVYVCNEQTINGNWWNGGVPYVVIEQSLTDNHCQCVDLQLRQVALQQCQVTLDSYTVDTLAPGCPANTGKLKAYRYRDIHTCWYI